MTNQAFNTYAELVPKHWPEIKVATMEDVLYFGKKNLDFAGRHWRAGNELAKSTECFMLSKVAEDKPPFVGSRGLDWFEIDDEVRCLIDGDYMPGKITDGLDHHSGFVSVKLNEKVDSHSSDYYYDGYAPIISKKSNSNERLGHSRNGRDFICSILALEIIKKWEYNYFKTHPKYLKIWTKCANSSLLQSDPTKIQVAIVGA